jgi:hypothetical protein
MIFFLFWKRGNEEKKSILMLTRAMMMNVLVKVIFRHSYSENSIKLICCYILKKQLAAAEKIYQRENLCAHSSDC